MTTQMLGPGPDQSRQVRILNRVVSWSREGLQYEADQRHAEIIVADLGLESAKPLTTPGSREDAAKAGPPSTTSTKRSILKPRNHKDSRNHYGEAHYCTNYYIHEVEHCEEAVDAEDEEVKWPERNGLEEHELLGTYEAKAFRGLAARLNYLAQDRPELQYAAKEVSRRMARPSSRDWQLLKRVGRYLVGAPRAVLTFWWQGSPGTYDTFVDSDWAGCSATCRSTSGGAVKL